MLDAPIECLPLDAIVQILCKLTHHELKPVINVSKFFHEAVNLARQWHFDFSTPPTKTWVPSGEMDESPEAPLKQHSKKPRKIWLSKEETQRIAVVLFPAADCKRELASRLNSNPEKIPSHHQTFIHASQANA
ncbi:uncharacterized protein LOC143886138 [Tasmannia lanceolata]|uniref:uncharacterized protein LOC143886138 n=1 Tax=Tasmannia lanceolata TaxID=3420 RepID=UPI0040646D83